LVWQSSWQLANWQLANRTKDESAKFLGLGILGAFVVIVVHGLVDVPYFKNDLACLFWVLIALLSLLRLQQKNLSN
jgi:hypothetical protein